MVDCGSKRLWQQQGKKNSLPPVNWRWVEEGDEYVGRLQPPGQPLGVGLPSGLQRLVPYPYRSRGYETSAGGSLILPGASVACTSLGKTPGLPGHACSLHFFFGIHARCMEQQWYGDK